MKDKFGNTFSRLLWGGVALSSIEKCLLQIFVERMPQKLRAVIEQQVDRYNLVQRESDGRAINFYRKEIFVKNAGAPLFTTKLSETKLLSIKFRIEGEEKNFDANFWA